ncbi:hypothetical protein A4A36_10920 [Bacillus subtilis]|nr:hypothetical protein A4A35_02425 [Bacillus subtilis]OIS66955.1 hypothetical protein A4A37_16480 [Bacillus subtilis]OIS70968.1 hypothetical protein A4A36_10920 [Bacillus subtilis]
MMLADDDKIAGFMNSLGLTRLAFIFPVWQIFNETGWFFVSKETKTKCSLSISSKKFFISPYASFGEHMLLLLFKILDSLTNLTDTMLTLFALFIFNTPNSL